MDAPLFVAIVVVLMLGSVLQGAAGFGLGMFAIPILILLGCRPYEAIVYCALAAGLQSIVGLWWHRAHVPWRQCLVMIALAAIGVPFGVLLLERVSALEPARVRQVFGGVILAALLVKLLLRVRPRDRLHPAWLVVAMVLSGFMAGLAGMGGPPAVLWVMAHRWSGERSRVTLWALFAGLTPIQLFFLERQFGDPVIAALGTGAILAPLTILGIVGGLRLGVAIPKPRLRQLSYIILFLISGYAIVQPML
jgi:uncharacterized membrane protein YfcA